MLVPILEVEAAVDVVKHVYAPASASLLPRS